MSQVETFQNAAKRRCFVHFDLQMRFAPQRRAIFEHRSFKKWPESVVFCTFWLTNVLLATAACHFNIGTSKSGPRVWCFAHFDLQMHFSPQRRAILTSELQKVAWECGVLRILTYKCASRHSGVQFFRVPPWGVLYMLTWKYASRHSGVPFLNIGTSKIAPTVRCFVHFDLQMCFAPQQRAIFGHRSFKNWSEIVVFCTFWLTNVLRATAACNFSGSELPKLVPSWGVLYMLTWKYASRHSGVPLLNIGTSKIAPTVRCFVHFDLQMCFAPQQRAIFGHRSFKNWSEIVVFCAFCLENVLRATAACHFSSVCKNRYLRTRRFTEPTFRTSGSTNHWKNTAIRDVPNISRTCTFFLVTLHACWSSFYWLYTRVDLLSADLTSLLCFSTLLTWHLYSAFQLCILSEVRLLNFLRSNHTFTVNLPQLFGIYVGVFFVYRLFLPHGKKGIVDSYPSFWFFVYPVPCPHETATTLKNGPFITQWFPLITHDAAQLDLPCRQLVSLTLLRLKPWRCSELCWCPVCKASVEFGKWLGHRNKCTLPWHSPVVFTVWWINPVDRLTCAPCGTLRNNILKQLCSNQQDVAWRWLPSTPRKVQILSCQEIEQGTRQMTQMNVCNAFTYGRLDAQTWPAGFVQQQCYCKNIQLMRDQRVGTGELLSWEAQSSSNIVRVDVWVVNQWWIRMILRRKQSVPKICFPRWTHACHSQVSIPFFGLWSPRLFVVASFGVGPMFPCNTNHRSNEQLWSLKS